MKGKKIGGVGVESIDLRRKKRISRKKKYWKMNKWKVQLEKIRNTL